MRSLLFLAALLAGGGYLAIRHTPAEAEAEPIRRSRTQEIQSVALDGRGLPTAALRELLTTHAGDLIDTAKLVRDRAALEEALVARGFLAAKVAAARITFDAGGAAFVRFAIEQGPQFRVRSVIVTGADEKDAGIVTIAAGDVAMADRIDHARDVLAERLAARGKGVVVIAHMHSDLASSTVDLELAALR